jgi:hypothetical protein
MKSFSSSSIQIVQEPYNFNAVVVIKAAKRESDRIQRIDLTSCVQVNDVFLKEIIPHCKNIRFLSLWGCSNITDESVEVIAAHCPFLRELIMSGCRHITDEGISAVGRSLTRLLRLDLLECPNITSTSVSKVIWTNPGLIYLLPGFLRSIPQEQEQERSLES